MISSRLRMTLHIVAAFVAALIVLSAAASAQVRRPNSPASPRPSASPTPPPSRNLPEVISRAEEYDEQAAPPDEPEKKKTSTADVEQRMMELQEKIKQLESGRRSDPDEKEKKLLLNLEILTKAEQRAESLRKQFFDMIEKENSLQTRLDSIENESRPEAIERAVAGIGSLRPEELRAARRRNLESEKNNLQNLLAEVQRHRNNLELNITKADALVERLRLKLESDIDASLNDEPGRQP